MKYSELEEAILFKAKRAFDKIITAKDGEITFNREGLRHEIEVPEPQYVLKIILNIFKNYPDSEDNVQKLRKRFPNIEDVQECILEEKYSVEHSYRGLMRWVGFMMDIPENAGSIYMLLNEHKLAEKYVDGREFLLNSVAYFYKNNGIQATEEQKEIDQLLNKFNEETKYLETASFYLNSLLELAETIQEAIRLHELVQEVEESQQQPAVERRDEEIRDTATLDKTTHKIVLIHELGVIGPLKKFCKEKNPALSDTAFAAIVSHILGYDDAKSKETVRKGLSGYAQGTRDDPKTDKALNTVKALLIKNGIEL